MSIVYSIYMSHLIFVKLFLSRPCLKILDVVTFRNNSGYLILLSILAYDFTSLANFRQFLLPAYSNQGNLSPVICLIYAVFML